MHKLNVFEFWRSSCSLEQAICARTVYASMLFDHAFYRRHSLTHRRCWHLLTLPPYCARNIYYQGVCLELCSLFDNSCYSEQSMLSGRSSYVNNSHAQTLFTFIDATAVPAVTVTKSRPARSCSGLICALVPVGFATWNQLVLNVVEYYIKMLVHSAS